jgi:hypothetical protein
MATDLTGFLTGITSAPIDPMLNASLGQRAIARGEALGKSMRQNIGAFTGANTQTTKEKVEGRLAQLDINEPNDQEEILKLVSVVNPQGAAQLKAQFAQQGRVRATEGKAKTKAAAQRTGFADYLERTYPDKGYGALALQGLITPDNMKNFIKENTSANRERFNVLNETTGKMEIISQNKDGTERKVEGIAKAADTPSPIPIINEAASTVAFVDPFTQEQIGQTISIKSEEQLEREREEARVKLETRNMALTTGRGNLASKTAGIRQAVEGLQSTGAGSLFGSRFESKLQESFPIAYGSLVQNDEYLNIVDLVDSIKSDQALSVIAEMKSQSRTGATGLGNTNVMEIALLQDEIAKLNPDNPEALEAGMQAIERHWDNVIKITNGEQPDIPWTVPEEKSDGSIEYKVNPSYSSYVSVRPDGSLAFSVDGGNSFYPVPVPYTYKGQTFN